MSRHLARVTGRNLLLPVTGAAVAHLGVEGGGLRAHQRPQGPLRRNRGSPRLRLVTPRYTQAVRPSLTPRSETLTV